MSVPNTTYRVLVEKLGDSDPSTFIGNEGEVFYDPNNPVLKLSNGSTVGGVSIGGTDGGTANTGDVTFSGVSIIGDSTDEFSLGVIQLIPALNDEENETPFVDNGQYVNVYPTIGDDAPHIHITAGTLSTTSNYYYYDEEDPAQYLKGDLFLGDDNNYVSVYGNGRLELYSGSYGSSIDITNQISINSPFSIDLNAGNSSISLSPTGSITQTCESEFSLTSGDSITLTTLNENNIPNSVLSVSNIYTGLVGVTSEYAGLIGFTNQFNDNYSAIGESEYGIVLQVYDGNDLGATPDNLISMYKSGTYFGTDYCFGKVEDNSVVGISTSLIYETKNFVGVGNTIGSLKLIIQCNGDGGGTQLSELLVIKQYDGENVYQSETSRATSGIGTVNFISSYNSENESIEVYAESSDEQIWSIRVIPLEIKSFFLSFNQFD